MLEDALLIELRRQQRGNPEDCKILVLWREGFDTFDIAEMLGVPEHQIANRLIHIRSHPKSTDSQKTRLVYS